MRLDSGSRWQSDAQNKDPLADRVLACQQVVWVKNTPGLPSFGQLGSVKVRRWGW